jgi:octaprenyl-diphosphate synthase
MLHLSSLVHDDIIDHSSWRRGEKTPNHHFGDCLSLLWGDFLFITSIRMLTREGCAEAIDMLAEVSRQMVEGQVLEFENSFNYRIQPRVYYNIIRKKTSSMFAGIAVQAARLAGKEAASAAHFYRFGQDFGMIFQISDDLLDLFSDRAGKSRFQDLKEGKVTLPYILLLQGGGLPLLKRFDRSTPGPLLARCRELNIQERSLAVIDRYHQRCSRFLRSFPPSPYRDSLGSLLEFVRYREY